MAKYFKTLIQKDILFSLLVCLSLSFFLAKLVNLTYQSLWLDEGFYILAVQKILAHGFPLYPSGHILFKGIFYSYSLSGFALIFGQSIFIYRLFSLLIHILTPLVIYKTAKNHINKHILFISGIILFLFTWETEYARTALYYTLLQFLFTLSIILFIRNKILAEQKRFAVPWILTSLTHQLGMGLAFTFPAYLVMYPKRFFKKKNLLSLIFWVPFFLFIMFQEIFLWRVGQVYANQNVNETANILGYFFKQFKPVYLKLLHGSHPYSFIIFLIGFLILCAYLLFNKFYRKKEVGRTESILCFLSLSLIFILLGLGLMRTHPMARYIFPFHYLYIICVVSFIYLFIKLLSKYFKILKKSWVIILTSLILAYFAFSQAGFAHIKNIILRDYDEPVNTDIIYASGRPFPVDHDSCGRYVHQNIKKGDTVIAIHMIFQFLNVKQVDYWLFTGGPGTWDAWEQVNGQWQDVYLGVPWINSLEKLEYTIQNRINNNGRVWIITSNSEAKSGHILPSIQRFLMQNRNKVKWISRDGIGKVYLFSPPTQEKIKWVQYHAEWGIYPQYNLIRDQNRNYVRITASSAYKTALIFAGNQRQRIKMKFQTASPSTIIEVSSWHQGHFETKKLMAVSKKLNTITIPFKRKGRYSIQLNLKKGPPVFLEYLDFTNESKNSLH